MLDTTFQKETVRKPEICGSCHLGPDHSIEGIVFIDVATAHTFNMFYPAYEWIPVIFGPLATISIIIILIFPKPGWIKSVNYFILTDSRKYNFTN